MAAIALAANSPGRAQTVHARRVALTGPSGYEGKAVWEPAVAAGRNSVIALSNVGQRILSRIAYAVYEQGLWRNDAILDPNTTTQVIDSSVVFNPYTDPNDPDEFIAAALLGSEHDIVVSHYPDPSDPNDFGKWESVADWDPDPNDPSYGVDKPWIVAGAEDEYYIVYRLKPPGKAYGYAYLRTTDGGDTWYPDPDPNDPNNSGAIVTSAGRVTGDFCAQPAVYDDGPLYVAYITGDVIAFLQGDDDGNEVNFTQLLKICHIGVGSGPQGHIALEIPLTVGDVTDYLPRVTWWQIKTVPQLAADPSDPDRLYVVYHDVAEDPNDPNDPNDVDVDVFLVVLEKMAGYNWCPSSRIRVNADNPPGRVADQFLPAVTVDTAGRIHVIYYDDRDFDQVDHDPNDPNEPAAKFNVYYAYSEDGGEDWNYRKLFALPDRAALDMGDDIVNYFEPGEYIGISYYRDTQEERDEVWTAFTGTEKTGGDPDDDEAVIWSSFIDWWDEP